MNCSLVVTGLALTLLQMGAAQADVLNTNFLSDYNVTVTPDPASPTHFDIRFAGVFLVPAISATVSNSVVGIAVDYDFGIATWFKDIPGNVYGGSFSGGAGLGFSSFTGWNDKYPGVSNPTDGPQWTVAVSQRMGTGSPYYGNELSGDGPYVVDGHVPVHFNLDLSVTAGGSYPIAVDPSYVIYIGGLSLRTFVGDGYAGSGNGDISFGSSSGIVWSMASIGSGGDAIPASIRAQLPSYIPGAISAVPEPPSLFLSTAGLLTVMLRRRVQKME